MNKGIAHILLKRLKDIPFVDLKGGLVSLQEQSDTTYNESDRPNTVIKRFPATADILEFGHRGLKAMVPDSSRRGILYFEDLGIQPTGTAYGFSTYRSSLRLVVWVNTQHVHYTGSSSLALPMATKIIHCFKGPFNDECYSKVIVTADRIPRTGKEIFSAYTYDNEATQYLMPPYEYFAIDFKVEFSVNPGCVDDIKMFTSLC